MIGNEMLGDRWGAEAREILTDGVLSRRIAAWWIDGLLMLLLTLAAWFALTLVGVLTLGFGLPLLAVLPAIPFLYNVGFLAGQGATPGQQALGLLVVREADLGPPGALQALISTIGFYVTLAAGAVWLAIALFTHERRTLHDMLSGLVVVRRRRLTAAPGFWNMSGGPTAA